MLGWELPPHNSGGLGVACFYMAKALAKSGASIEFVVPYKDKHTEIDFMKVLNATNFSEIHKFGAGAYDSSYWIRSSHNASNFLPDIRSIQKEYCEFIREYLSVPENKPDVIHAHDWLTMEAGMLAREITGSPLVTHIHATEFDRSGGTSGNQQIHDKYKVSPEKVEVVYNAIETSTLASPQDYDERTYRYLEYLKSQGYTVVMTLTRFTVQKGLTYLMRAMAEAASRNPKIALLLVGDGEQRNELIKMASDFRIADKIFFTGFLRGDKWRDAYGVADVFVMSSVNEPFGLTALEAAHFNNALIISKQSGVGEVLQNILRYDFWDTKKLANQIYEVSVNKKLLDNLKKGVRKEYNKISWSDIADQIMDEFIHLTEEKNG